MWWTKTSQTYLKVELDWTWARGEIKLNLCRCLHQEEVALHHQFFGVQMKKVVDVTLFEDTMFDDTLFDDTMYNYTMFDNASLLSGSMPHNVKLHKPIE